MRHTWRHRGPGDRRRWLASRRRPHRAGKYRAAATAAYAPELNPLENIWAYLRGNAFGHQVWETYEAILDACCNAWNSLTKIPELIKSIARRTWSEVRI